MGHAIDERVFLFGTRSADYIRATGQSGCIAMEASLQRKQAEYMTAPERFAEKSDSLLHRGRRPYMTHSGALPPQIAALRKVYSITSSASESRLSEILTPMAFAVLRLITSSNLVGCSTGRSAGLAPLRTWPV